MFQSVIVKNTFASIASVVVVVESPPPPPSRRLRALSRPRRRCRPNFVALRLLLFLGCNRISGQTQSDIASPCTAILRLACHRG